MRSKNYPSSGSPSKRKLSKGLDVYAVASIPKVLCLHDIQVYSDGPSEIE